MKGIVLAVLLVLMQLVLPSRTEAIGGDARLATAGDRATSAIIEADTRQTGPNAQRPLVVSRLPPVSISRDWADWTLWVFSAVLAIAAVVGGCLAWRTIKAIEKQATAQMNADRAWVVIHDIGNPAEPLFDPDNPGYVPGIVYRMKIVGNTPARIIEQRYRCRIVPAIAGTASRQPDLEPLPEYQEGSELTSDIVRGPGDMHTVSVSLESGPLTAKQFVELRDGKSFLCAYGCLGYVDAFGRKASTQFSFVYDFAFGGVITSPDGTVLNPPGFRRNPETETYNGST